MPKIDTKQQRQLVKDKTNKLKQIPVNEIAQNNKNPKVQQNTIVGSREQVENTKALATWKHSDNYGLTESELIPKIIIGQKGPYNDTNIASIKNTGQVDNNTKQEIRVIKFKNNEKPKQRFISAKASDGAKNRNNWVKYCTQIKILANFSIYMTFPEIISNRIVQMMYNSKLTVPTRSPEGVPINIEIDAPISPNIFVFIWNRQNDLYEDPRYKRATANGINPFTSDHLDYQSLRYALEIEWNKHCRQTNQNHLIDKFYWLRYAEIANITEEDLVLPADYNELLQDYNEHKIIVKNTKNRNVNQNNTNINQEDDISILTEPSQNNISIPPLENITEQIPHNSNTTIISNKSSKSNKSKTQPLENFQINFDDNNSMTDLPPIEDNIDQVDDQSLGQILIDFSNDFEPNQLNEQNAVEAAQEIINLQNITTNTTVVNQRTALSDDEQDLVNFAKAVFNNEPQPVQQMNHNMRKLYQWIKLINQLRQAHLAKNLKDQRAKRQANIQKIREKREREMITKVLNEEKRKNKPRRNKK